MRGLIALLLLLGTAAHGGALDEAFLQSDPCKRLPQINRTAKAEITGLEMSLRNDTLTLTTAGHISCQTKRSAFINARASTDFTIFAQVDVASCSVPDVTVDLHDFDGPLLDQIAPLIETQLEDNARRKLVAACEDLRD